jgi:hypothetical protein
MMLPSIDRYALCNNAPLDGMSATHAEWDALIYARQWAGPGGGLVCGSRGNWKVQDYARTKGLGLKLRMESDKKQ